ncbi:hypothetical protein AB0387_26035 [Streptomyces sp. NPDC089173]|uniref:hypothetical protein n=1 Tax=Streptomyces sp. NPDC089173 TaxID=3154965 RepID=UPI00344E796A
MTAAGDLPADRSRDQIKAQIGNIARAQRTAEDHGRHDTATFLGQAVDCGLDELNALNNTRERTRT